MAQYAPGGAPARPRPQDDRAPPDHLDPAVVDAILNLVNSRLDENRNFNNPAVLDEIRNLIRNFDPADDIVGRVETLCSEAETETEIPTIMQGFRLDHAPSFLDPPATRFEFRGFDPPVRDEMLPLSFDFQDHIFDFQDDPRVRDEMLPLIFDFQDDPAPPDLDPAVVDAIPPDVDPAVVDTILNLVNSHLDENRNFNNPAVLDEIQKLIRNFDPAAGDIVGEVEKLCLEENNQRGEQEPACTDGPSSSTETESPTIVQGQGGRLDHAPSDLDPAILDKIRRLGPGVLDEMLKAGPLILDRIRNHKAGSLPPGECWTYLRTGTCKNRSSCKYKHPPRSNGRQVSKDKAKEKGELAEKPGRPESKNEFKSEGHKNGKASKSNHNRGQTSVTSVGENFTGLPIPLVSKDKGMEKEGLTEKPGRPESKVFKGKEKKKEVLAEKPGRTEIKNEFRSQGCKNGKAGMSNRSRGQPSGENFMGVPTQPNGCRSEGRKNAKVRTSNHSRGQPSVAPAGENFLGLPIRPGAKECPYYMQHGACKDELNCKYNHPDPEAAGESDPVSTYGSGGPATFQGASPSTVVEPSSAPRSLNRTCVPPTVIPPSQWGPTQNEELYSYQDQNICPHYSRYGIGRFEACTFDHPLHITSSSTSGPDQQLPFSDSAANWE